MPNTKQYLKAREATKKQSKQKPREPETVDEILAAGVEFEEAAEKWRAGDAAKSARFFVRAIEKYENGLRLFPTSFDLAYNKARTQYEITQYPALAAQIPTPLIDQLRIALDSHKIALKLQQNDADLLLFVNTAQALTSLADAVSGEGKHHETVQEASKLLEEALELFQRCLTLQEFELSESQAGMGMEAPDSSAAGASSNDSSMEGVTATGTPKASEEEQWALIVEAVTKDTLLDTAMAQLDTLTTLCNVLAPDVRSQTLWSETETMRVSRSLAWIEEYSSDLLRSKISVFEASNGERLQEILLARANVLCSLADANYRVRRIDLATYERDLVSIWIAGESPIDLPTNYLCDRADALIMFCTSLNIFPPPEISILHPPAAIDHLRGLAWKYLTLALESLTAASKTPTAQNAANIQLSRGDAEMLRFRLSRHPINLKVAQKSADTLIKNAQVYYRGAAAFAKNTGMLTEEREGIVKESVAALAGGEVGKWDSLMNNATKGVAKEELCKIIEDMLEEGLVEGALETGQSTGRVPLSGTIGYNGGPLGNFRS